MTTSSLIIRHQRVRMPTFEPLTLAEIKLYLKIDGSEEDTLLLQLLSAAREAAEEFLRYSVMQQAHQIAFGGSLCGAVRLPYGPVTLIEEVALYSESGEQTIVGAAHYHVTADAHHVAFSMPIVAPTITVQYEAGHANAADVPASIRQGILMHMAQMYEASSIQSTIPEGALALYHPFRDVAI